MTSLTICKRGACLVHLVNNTIGSFLFDNLTRTFHLFRIQISFVVGLDVGDVLGGERVCPGHGNLTEIETFRGGRKKLGALILMRTERAFLKADNRFLLFKNKRGIMESKQP
jgi:hypothetical protein